MSPRGLSHVALRVADVARAVEFYAGLLGLALHSLHEEAEGSLRSAWLELGGGALLMVERALRGVGPESGSGHVLVLAVEELEGWEQRLAEAGVGVCDRTRYTLFFCDPDGHRVGLSIFTPGPRQEFSVPRL